ncbi:MAG: hypothetical protein MJY66_03320 [Bacteroidaceae bacterium]|nr:hypothetical protein [Bacteroidaceae bacterium]
MKQINSRKNRSHICGLVCLSALAAFGVSSCTPDYDLDTRFPEWLGSSIYETLQEGITDENGKTYHFDNYVRLIDDLDYKNVLAKTGSKTLFVADDEAFERFLNSGVFKNAGNGGTVTYDDLSLAQKKMILNGSMLNNVYQVAMLSSSEGPVLGDCMRRISSASIYDSLTVLNPSDMPETKQWKFYKNSGKSIPIFQDATKRPIVFFVNKFLTAKKITDEDYDFLFNQGPKFGKPSHQPGDATVNGVKILIQNKKCFNGFLHVMEDVIYSLPNMAEFINEAENARIFSSILNRYCAPYPVQDGDIRATFIKNVQEHKLLLDIPGFDLDQDTLFQMRFFSQRTAGNVSNSQTPGRANVAKGNLLKFDPGWNTYYSSTSSTTTADVALQQNMGVILVPLDTVLMDWWVNTGGKALRERYSTLHRDPVNIDEVIQDMDSVPDEVISKLVNVNMLNSLVGSVPSKFDNVLDDANDKMGIQPDDVQSVQMCCNGAIYFTTKVFSPTAYRSVSYPVLVTESLKIIDWAINEYDFDAYLNSMVATYSFFVPAVTSSDDPKLEGRMIYIDPVSFGNRADNAGHLKALVFNYNNSSKAVEARIFDYNDSTNTVITTGTGTSASSDQIRDRLEDLLDYHIIIGDVEANPSYKYYKTKGRGTIYFDFSGDISDPSSSKVAGGYQLESPIMYPGLVDDVKILNRHDLSKNSSTKGNGRTYVIDKPLQTSRKSVYDILSDSAYIDNFGLFFDLMEGSGTSAARLFTNRSNGHAVGSQFNVSTFNTYHYTLYVPTNESVQALLDAKVLYSPEMIDALENEYDSLADVLSEEVWETKMDDLYTEYRAALPTDYDTTKIVKRENFTCTAYTDALKLRLTDFVKYHIQDNSVYVNAEFNVDLRENPAGEANYETAFMNGKQQFEKLTIKGGTDVIVTDKDRRHTRTVQKKTNAAGLPLYNIMCREYEYNNANASSATQIETSSYVVIHQIDGPLCNGEVIF